MDIPSNEPDPDGSQELMPFDKEDEPEPYKKEYLQAPFFHDTDSIESVNLSTGSLELNYVDFTLPGKDGFDLTLARSYDSAKSNTNSLTPKYITAKKMYEVKVTYSANVRSDTGNIVSTVYGSYGSAANKLGLYYATKGEAAAERAAVGRDVLLI